MTLLEALVTGMRFRARGPHPELAAPKRGTAQTLGTPPARAKTHPRDQRWEDWMSGARRGYLTPDDVSPDSLCRNGGLRVARACQDP